MAPSNNFGLWQCDNNIDVAMPINSSTTYYEDSNVYWDATGLQVLPLTNDTNAANFAGVIREVSPVSVYGETSLPNQPSKLCRVTRIGQFVRNCTVGESYNPGIPVYAGADEQTISMSGTNKIGFVSFEQAAIVTATAGQTILIDHRVKPPYGVAL